MEKRMCRTLVYRTRVQFHCNGSTDNLAEETAGISGIAFDFSAGAVAVLKDLLFWVCHSDIADLENWS